MERRLGSIDDDLVHTVSTVDQLKKLKWERSRARFEARICGFGAHVDYRILASSTAYTVGLLRYDERHANPDGNGT
jgi:hypothetical protein